MYIVENVRKNTGAGAGAPVPNKPNVTLVRSEDILSRPVRDGKGVRMVGNYVLKPGARMFTVYMVPSKQDKGYESEGDEDMLGIMQKFTGVFPGDTLEVNEMVQNNLGVDLEIIADNCVDGTSRVYGTECAPMKLKPTAQVNNDGTMHTLVFEQYTRTRFVPGFYSGTKVFAEPFETDGTVDLATASGEQYRFEEFDVATAIDIVSTDLAHGTRVTFVGSGGAADGTLSDGAGTAATVKLKNGADWIALDNATITFVVFTDGATTFLFEESRS